LPSRGEGTPLSILDAMNYSLPVISTNVWGIPSEVIDKKTGYLIEKDNVDQLKNNLNILIRDDKKRIRMGKEGRKHLIKNFSEKIVEKKLDKVYEEALK
jgi:glycosyltransferase involved in cell wall biosynthesis